MYVHPACDPFQIKPAREEDIVWAASLGSRVYGNADVIPERTMLEWFDTNPAGFSTFWHENRRIGNFDLLPLKAEPLLRFIDGTLLERDIRPTDLVTATQAAVIRGLHWESIALDPDFHGPRSRVLRLFVLSFPALLARLCPIEQIGHIYAIAASTRGSGVLQRMGLVQISGGSRRLDGHPLYRGTVDSYRTAAHRLFRGRLPL